MTKSQIDYWTLQESKRSNAAQEELKRQSLDNQRRELAEKERANRVNENLKSGEVAGKYGVSYVDQNSDYIDKMSDWNYVMKGIREGTQWGGEIISPIGQFFKGLGGVSKIL